MTNRTRRAKEGDSYTGGEGGPVLLQARNRGGVSGSQPLQLPLQHYPLGLQSGSRSQGHCHLLATLLQCVSLTELVHPEAKDTKRRLMLYLMDVTIP